ncbi:APC family permease [Arthrobacter sp.]|uniref:APC family permease n=1 Tax=Arthrobacter sp. TaxID=1667 RepID=UPI002585E8E5|nr:APC family permease [Arthrobacter sp.]
MSSPSPSLKRSLSLTSVVAFGLSYMAPSLVMVIFGIIAAASSGTAPTAFLIATLAVLLTALSYARMAGEYPESGSAYSYARRLIGAPVGFLVGWSLLLDYLFLPMVAWLTQSIYLNAQYPDIPIWIWMLINAGLTTGVNILGVVLSDRVNKVMAGAAMLIVLLFAAFCVVHLLGSPPRSVGDAWWNSGSTVSGVFGAAAIAAYSFLGFDAVTTLSEETKDPRRTIPRAVVLIMAIGGALFIGVALLMQLVHPGGEFDDPQIAGYTLSIQVGGQEFADWTNMAAIVAGFGSGLAVQLSSSRLLFTMGRDGVLPRRVFGALNSRTKTPVYALLVTGAMCFVGLSFDLTLATSFINFGAFSAFTVVNLCVVVHYVRNRRRRRLNPVTHLALPAAGAVVTLWMLTQLGGTALASGLLWLAAGFLYLLWLTRGFRRPTPRMTLDDAAEGQAPEPARA